jgi:hypothetical protein
MGYLYNAVGAEPGPVVVLGEIVEEIKGGVKIEGLRH